MNQPFETPVVGDATLGWVFACSRIGSSHARAGKPCQDAYAIYAGSGSGVPCLAIAVADGHGDERHDLSHVGSALAARAAMEELIALCTCDAAEGRWGQLKASFKSDFPRRLGRRWRDGVLADHDQRVGVGGCASNPEREGNPLVRYGTTLIAALVAGDVLLLGQIGDGDVLLVTDDGEVERLVVNNRLEIGGETDSLSSVESHRLWRTSVLEYCGGVLLLATDGLVNAFADDAQFDVFARSLRERTRNFGPVSVASELPKWLERYSREASGDDITLAVAVLRSSSVSARESLEPQADESVQPQTSGSMVNDSGASVAAPAEGEAVVERGQQTRPTEEDVGN